MSLLIRMFQLSLRYFDVATALSQILKERHPLLPFRCSRTRKGHVENVYFEGSYFMKTFEIT